MNQKRSRMMFFLLLMLTLANFLGCSGIRSSLNVIDASYKHEFYDKVVPQDDGIEKFTNKDLFVETLNLIDKFIRDYKDEGRNSEIAHVKVLQSLIYLQKGEFHKARLAIKLAENYKAHAEERDSLLIESLPQIIWGWQASEAFKNNRSNDTKNALRTLDSALNELDKKNYKIFYQKENRERGGEEIYLYLTAARSILHHNRAHIIRDIGYDEYSTLFNRDASEQVKDDYEKATKQLKEVLKEYITEDELEVLRNAQFNGEGISSEWFKGESRYVRYKALYIFLKEKKKRFLNREVP